MHALVLHRPAPIESSPLALSDLPVPEPGPGQVRIRVRACGLCHTDLHIIEGELSLPKLPLVPGHQIVGIVDAIGRGVTSHRVGQRVGVPWLHSTCGRCMYCTSGRENLCDSARFTGYHVDGGYAEYVLAEERTAYPLPEGPSDVEVAPLLCAGVIGYRALRLSEAKRGGTLGLYGFGASAHIVIQIARHMECRIFVFSRSEEHRQLALKLGAEWVGRAEDVCPTPLDSAIIFAPVGALVPLALRALAKGGTLALAGIHMSAVPQMDYSLLYGERTIRSVANSTRRDVAELLRLAADIPIRTETQAFQLEEANQALALLKAGRIRGAAVLRVS